MTPATGTTKLAAKADSSSGVGATPVELALFGVGFGVEIMGVVSATRGTSTSTGSGVPPFDADPLTGADEAPIGDADGRMTCDVESREAPFTCASPPFAESPAAVLVVLSSGSSLRPMHAPLTSAAATAAATCRRYHARQ
jgi:hypothetical protein